MLEALDNLGKATVRHFSITYDLLHMFIVHLTLKYKIIPAVTFPGNWATDEYSLLMHFSIQSHESK